MIAKLIDWCIHNRVMVLLLAAALIAGGAWSAGNVTVDAIPDLSDVQVVIRTDYPGQAPQIVQDQVTYPLTTAMLAVPKAKTVRGYSMFGTSFVYVIFEDGTDLYWARSRTLEQLSTVGGRLPANVAPQLGPDATGVGWVYEYALVTGKYCPDHPDGAWLDPDTGRWYASPGEVADQRTRGRLVHHRVFTEAAVGMNAGMDLDKCPLDGKPLVDPKLDLSDLRGLQDWYLRYELTAVDGASEVAPVGGFVKQYQVVVDPVKLLAYDLPLAKVRAAVKASNLDVGGRLVERGEREFMVRGVGYLGSLTPAEVAEAKDKGELIENARTKKALAELKQVALGATADGSPIYLADVADVRTGPEIRRGIAEWNGVGETVGAIIVMRQGENARDTIDRVKAKLGELEEGLPPGVEIKAAYDRGELINRAVETLSGTLTEEVVVVSLVIVLFLLHARSALVAALVLPAGVLLTLLAMYLMGLNANIMSLGGIAISIGVMVDSSIVMVENAHKHLEDEKERVRRGGEPRPHAAVIADACREVGPTLFFSLLIITVSFVPIFVLGEQSGRLFRPLAFTKTFAIGIGALLAVTLIPVASVYLIRERGFAEGLPRWKRLSLTAAVALVPAAAFALLPLGGWHWWIAAGWAALALLLLLPQRIISEERNPISRMLQAGYNPFFNFVMGHPWLTLLVAAGLMASTIYPFSRLGNEFMPPLGEGDLLYMPTTDPGLSGTKARELLQQTDALLAKFPEVENVFGKIGRAETATDPAPLSMVETIVTLNREKSQWRQVPVPRFYDGWPDWLAALPRKALPDARPITQDELVYGYDLPNPGGERIHVPGMNEVLQLPGVTNSWTMPIKTRIDMLSTGIKTPVGVKVMGPDLATLADLGQQVAQALKSGEGVGKFTTSAFAEKSVGGSYLTIRPDRAAIARYNLSVEDVQSVIMSAMGGMNVTTTVEGLERYPVNLRYPAELRDNVPALKDTLVATPAGAQVPLGQLAGFETEDGPPMVKSENARLTSWVYVDISGLDVGTYVERAQQVVSQNVKLPAGYSIVWSGQYEYIQAARAKLMVAVPLAGVLIVLLLYLATKSWLRVGIVLLAVPFSLVGAAWLVYLLDYNLSLAVWVGVIALAGLDAETGLVMLLYLDNSYDRFKRDGRMRNAADLWHAVHDGAVQRIRPKTMTVCTTFIGLVPLLWATGAGADTMRRLAAPMVGGLAVSFAMELLVYPVLFYLARRATLPKPESSAFGSAGDRAAAVPGSASGRPSPLSSGGSNLTSTGVVASE